ncbi:nitroreductase family protein [Nitrogeniibacter aestuarii]|uniref:SagB/ThcOx family dehydrogenase n=1 Tax=Nitrogeniibacter aestuarii TaxID=2815343 RepID=UPI001E631FE5|nr:SagB/ThcOx family dehydrogenase [Nitrogeniibacter aestuarii]
MDTKTVRPPADDRSSHSGAVSSYHARTAHRFEAFAQGPESLDWDAQPAPFRHYVGCNTVDLPRLDTFDSTHLRRGFGAIQSAATVQPLDLAHLGALLQLSLGLTAWKSFGPDRWALRANPSSGNLHPVEAWVIARGVPDLVDGVHHYRPERHALSLRAADAPGVEATPSLSIAISSVMWREAWKYGERAFRYCQLDVGHALGSLRYAAAVLGWTLAEQRQVGHDTLAHRLGLDREADYPARRQPTAEREEPEVLLSVGLGADAPRLDPVAVAARADEATWFGTASTIDPHPMYRWPVIDDVATRTRRRDGTPAPDRSEQTAIRPNVTPPDQGPAVTDLILQRRSAQRFDHVHVMSRRELRTVLEVLDARLPVPFDVLPEQARVDLVMMIHRVADLPSGLYLVERHNDTDTPSRLADTFAEFSDLAPIPDLPLRELRAISPQVLKRVSRTLHCQQDIAATACLALGMVVPLESALKLDPASYRDLHRAAGLIGQTLYLVAESLGLRGTGIGCFFDGPVRESLALQDQGLTTLYHFTLGKALDDPRIETTPAYTTQKEPTA